MIAVTFPGMYGDCLWSLATVKQLAHENGPVDFYVSEKFGSLDELIKKQLYINDVIVLEDWHITALVPGAQPWEHPEIFGEYDRVIPLGYKSWPHMALIDFIASQAGMTLKDPIPFIEIDAPQNYDVAVGFSQIYLQYPEYIEKFIEPYKEALTDSGIVWHDVSHLNNTWIESAQGIAGSKVFIGDNSALSVLARGLGTATILAESNPDRRAATFLSPYNNEYVFQGDNIMNHLPALVNQTKTMIGDI